MTRGAPSNEWTGRVATVMHRAGESPVQRVTPPRRLPPLEETWPALRAIATRLEPVPEARWSGTTDELRAAYYDGSEP